MFCKGPKSAAKSDTKRLFSLEKPAINIIHYGFPYCKKPLGINLRMVYDPEELLHWLQDNCPLNAKQMCGVVRTMSQAGKHQYTVFRKETV